MKNDQTYINELLKQYPAGSISEQDRHELERIALDDPFVFDSLEGYTAAEKAKSEEVIKRIISRTAPPKDRVINMRSISLAAGIAMLIGGLFWVNGQLNQSQSKKLSQVAMEEIVKQDQSAEVNTDSANFIDTTHGGVTGNAVFDDSPKSSSSIVKEKYEIIAPKEKTSAIIQSPKDKIVTRAQSDSESVHDPIVKTNQTSDIEIAQEELAELRTNDQVVKSKKPITPVNSPKPESSKTSVATTTVIEGRARLKKRKETSVIDEDPFVDSSLSYDPFARKKQQVEVLNKRAIKGLVRDNTGEPLIGTTISIPNSESATSTDIDGTFRLEVDSTADQLLITYVGFNDVVMDLDTSSSYDIILDEDNMALEEVVNVAGYSSNVNDEEPSFVLPPGGRAAYKDVIKMKSQSGCNHSGKVKLKFTVTKYGEVSDFEVKKGLSDECNQLAIQIIKNSGRWDNQFNKDKKVRYSVSF